VYVLNSGPTEKMSFLQSLTSAMDISLSSDPSTLVFGEYSWMLRCTCSGCETVKFCHRKLLVWGCINENYVVDKVLAMK